MKDQTIYFRVTNDEKERINNNAVNEGLNLSNYIRSRIVPKPLEMDQEKGTNLLGGPVRTLEQFIISDEIAEDPLELETDNLRISTERTIHGLFYGGFRKIDINYQKLCLSVPSNIARMLKIEANDTLYLVFNSKNSTFNFTKNPIDGNNFPCPVFAGQKGLAVVLPEDLSRELDLFPRTPILIYYFTLNDYFCCLKVANLFEKNQ